MPDHQHNQKNCELKEDDLAVPFRSDIQYLNNNDKLEEKIVLNTFVPLSDVKHSAPPGWVSKAHCTLPPTGKAETVKLRTLHDSSSSGINTAGQSTSSEKFRPRSTHLSPYRNQQSNGCRIGNVTNNVPGKVIRHSSRCGSLSPSSVSPTRLK